MKLSRSLQTALLVRVAAHRGARVERVVARAAQRPRETQWEVLARILSSQAETGFGRQHGFSEIRSEEEFRARVPIHDYEDLRPWIEEQDACGKPVLNREQPVCYALTSGTTGQPKYIPILADTLKAHRRTQDLFLFHLLAERPDCLKGRILAVVSPAVESHSPGAGIPCGSTSGQMYESIPALVRSKYVIPPTVFSVSDYDVKYLLILRLALVCPDITYLTTANPSTLARLIFLARTHWDRLLLDIACGGFHCLDALTTAERRAVERRLKADPKRALELAALKSEKGAVRIRDLWPELQAVGVWTGGSSSIFLDQLEAEFAEHTTIRDIGYLSSEFRGSVPLTSGTSAGVPTFWDNYFEFVSCDLWDAGAPKFLGLEELVDGGRYYVFVTTDAGLYRYHMNDIVEVNGFYELVPRLAFVQKGKGVTNISGEKLYESQVLSAVTEVEAEYKLTSNFYLMVADEHAARYVLYYEASALYGVGREFPGEAFEKSLDHALTRHNLEYGCKRKSGRIAAPRVALLRRGAFERFKRSCLARGQREGQFKIVALQYARDLHFDFETEVACEDLEQDWD